MIFTALVFISIFLNISFIFVSYIIIIPVYVNTWNLYDIGFLGNLNFCKRKIVKVYFSSTRKPKQCTTLQKKNQFFSKTGIQLYTYYGGTK